MEHRRTEHRDLFVWKAKDAIAHRRKEGFSNPVSISRRTGRAGACFLTGDRGPNTRCSR